VGYDGDAYTGRCDSYIEHGVFQRGAVAASELLEGFGVPVAEVFDTV
jgi:hypothetical protein